MPRPNSWTEPLNPVSRVLYTVSLIIGGGALAGWSFQALPDPWGFGVALAVYGIVGYVFRWLEDWRA
jgi:hypothetical protein